MNNEITMKEQDKQNRRSARLWEKARREAERQALIEKNQALVERMKKMGVWTED